MNEEEATVPARQPFADLPSAGCFGADLLGALIVLPGILGSQIPALVALGLVAVFIVSPVSLYFDRVLSTLVVFALIGGSWLVFKLRGDGQCPSKIAGKIRGAAFGFLAYMTLNGVWSILHGTDARAALNELVPVYEMYACFWLTTRLGWSEQKARQLILVILACVAARGLLQLGYFAVGKADLLIPPIKAAGEWSADDVSGYSFTRLIDPVSGLHVAIAFIVYWSGVGARLRVVSLLALATATSVLILGLMRSEWLGTAVCIALVLGWSRRRASRVLRQVVVVLGVLALSWVSLSLFFEKVSLNLGEMLSDRLISYSREQMFNPQNSLQILRLLEIETLRTAFVSAPLFGHGLGTLSGTVVSNGSDSQFVVFHNYYFGLIANAGAIGIGLLIFVVWRVSRSLRSLSGLAESPVQRACMLTAMAGLVWYGIFMGFQPILSAYHIPSLLGVYLGLAVSLADGTVPRPRRPCSPAGT